MLDFKKLFVLVLFILAALVSSARSSPFDGCFTFYGGGNLGVGIATNQFRNRLAYQDPLLPAFAGDVREARRKSNSTFLGELLLGIRYIFCTWITGMEVSGIWDSQVSKINITHENAFGPDNDQNVEVKIRRKYGIVPALIFGKEFRDKFLFFIKIGLSISQFNVKVKNIQDSRNFTFKKNTIGFVPSIGGEYYLTKNISFTVTSTYEYYRRFSKTFNEFLDPVGGLTHFDNIRIKPKILAFKVGLLFKI